MVRVHVSLHLLAARHLLCSRLQPCCAYTLPLLPTAIDPKLNKEIQDVWHGIFGHPSGASPEEMEQEKEEPAPPPTRALATSTAVQPAPASISAAVAHATAGAQHGAKPKRPPQKPRETILEEEAQAAADKEGDAEGGEEEDLSALKIAELKERLRERCLKVGGRHQELVERLQEAIDAREPAKKGDGAKAKRKTGKKQEAGVKRARKQGEGNATPAANGGSRAMLGIAHGGSQEEPITEMDFELARSDYGGF